MCENPLYCEACGDCIICFGEDPCFFSENGLHTLPEDDEVKNVEPKDDEVKI